MMAWTTVRVNQRPSASAGLWSGDWSRSPRPGSSAEDTDCILLCWHHPFGTSVCFKKLMSSTWEAYFRVDGGLRVGGRLQQGRDGRSKLGALARTEPSRWHLCVLAIGDAGTKTNRIMVSIYVGISLLVSPRMRWRVFFVNSAKCNACTLLWTVRLGRPRGSDLSRWETTKVVKPFRS